MKYGLAGWAILIKIDNCEKKSMVPSLLLGYKLPVEFCELTDGDYFVNDILIERKDASDFVGSMVKKHLNNQLVRMSTNYDRSILLVEGYISEAVKHRKINIDRCIEELASALYKRSPDGKQGVISLVCTETPFATATFIKSLHKVSLEGEVRMFMMEKVKVSDDKRIIYIVAGFPDIGEVRARSLLKKYGTPRNLFASKEWKSGGVGKKLNEMAQGLLDREYKGE